MKQRKTSKQYVFSVEGQTEKMYLEWLQNTINSSDASDYNVKFVIYVNRYPKQVVKRFSAIQVPVLNHFCDTESNAVTDCNNLSCVTRELINIKKEKHITSNLGYSNYTFELWMILHKQFCVKFITDKKHYLNILNKCYETNFENLAAYKNKSNFQLCLDKLSLNDVVNAINNAKKLQQYNKHNLNKEINSNGFFYYENNPATSVHIIIEKILSDCKIL